MANYVDRDKGKLGRITGLDPTIIFYQGTNRSHDLDPSDAHFIDVIHTGAGILGQRGPNGHVDYYVNGGTTQPGCQSDSLISKFGGTNGRGVVVLFSLYLSLSLTLGAATLPRLPRMGCYYGSPDTA